MTVFGFSLSEIPSVLTPFTHNFPWGTYLLCVQTDCFLMEKFCLFKENFFPWHFYTKKKGTYFLEQGKALLFLLDSNGQQSVVELQEKELFSIEPATVHAVLAKEPCEFFLFSKEQSFSERKMISSQLFEDQSLKTKFKTASTFDFREKYWGSIENILSEEISAKRIFMKKNSQSSLEFHCQKTEAYYIQKGLLKVGLRIGRGKNISVTLSQGQSFRIIPGLMHMRMALEDTLIMEISTCDSDKDSFLVEDGKIYQHIEE